MTRRGADLDRRSECDDLRTRCLAPADRRPPSAGRGAHHLALLSPKAAIGRPQVSDLSRARMTGLGSGDRGQVKLTFGHDALGRSYQARGAESHAHWCQPRVSLHRGERLGPSEPSRCSSSMWRAASLLRSSVCRHSASRPGGQVSGSLVPCSPRVAVMTATPSPRRPKVAMGPADVTPRRRDGPTRRAGCGGSWHWVRRQGGECFDLVGHGGGDLQQQVGDFSVVPLMAGDAIDDVEERDAESVAGGLVVLERIV